MNYQIVKDEKLLKDFIDWLPELKPTEKYYMCLFARNKYCKELTHIKSDKSQLKRFVTDKERMFQKIKQLEIQDGWYMQKQTPVPQQALALYITPNPRDMYKATINTMVKIATSVRDQNVLINVHQEAMSEIQRAKSRTCYVDFDIDHKEENYSMFLHEWIQDRIGYSSKYKLLETRGGFHILIDPSSIQGEEYRKTWHQAISKNQYIDKTEDNMIPVPGCCQGNFIPHFIN